MLALEVKIASGRFEVRIVLSAGVFEQGQQRHVEAAVTFAGKGSLQRLWDDSVSSADLIIAISPQFTGVGQWNASAPTVFFLDSTVSVSIFPR